MKPVPYARTGARPDPHWVSVHCAGPYGAVPTLGWDREVARMGAEAKQLKQTINSEWAHPPADDAQAILKLADHRTSWSTEAVGTPS